MINDKDASELLEPLVRRVNPDVSFNDHGYEGRARIEWFRAYAIQALITECARVFEAHIADILNGELHQSLIDLSDTKDEYNKVKDAVKERAYKDHRVLEVEAAGFQVISGLLDYFAPALVTPKSDRSMAEEKLFLLFNEGYLQKPGDKVDRGKAVMSLTTYQRLLAATDYVSGMTDSFAVDLYQKLSGIRLPS